MDAEIITYLKDAFGLEAVADSTAEQLEFLLAAKINQLITEDFSLLVQLLYRVDVNEQKLKKLLKDNTGTDAARIIAALIIERQLQKKSSWQSYRDDFNIADDSERW